MKVFKIKVENYRLLKKFSMDLEKELSLVIPVKPPFCQFLISSWASQTGTNFLSTISTLISKKNSKAKLKQKMKFLRKTMRD